MLELDGINVSYGKIDVLHDMSMSVSEHEIVTLIGSNGAGKTTTMMSISGLTKVRSGAIRFCGERIDTLPAHKVARLGIAQVAQASHLFRDMTVEENLALGSLRLGKGAARAAAYDEVYSYFDVLGRRRRQAAGSLSGGEQKMLAFGRALMSDPRLLLLDEPSAGLSPIMVKSLAAVVRELRTTRKLTTLIVEQNAVLALGLADRGYLLASGHVVASGSTAQLASSDAVKVAYLGM